MVWLAIIMLLMDTIFGSYFGFNAASSAQDVVNLQIPYEDMVNKGCFEDATYAWVSSDYRRLY